ncbi:MAG TPA: hypothetical protein VFQ00_06480 [Terriglobales bacterium]|nr:hypothetical protein [Terriglobales bacterium]
MARQIAKRDISPILASAESWIRKCLIKDGSLFRDEPLWTAPLVAEVYRCFVEHPDFSNNDFMTKLKGQMSPASNSAKRLMAELLWALLLFPSNMKPNTKRQQIREIWAMSGQPLGEDAHLLSDGVLVGIGSGGPGFHNYRPDELEFLICLVRDLKKRNESEREQIFTNYDAFFGWIQSVPSQGSRQVRHMLRYFAFPDRVERMSTNNDRRKILKAFGIGSQKEVSEWKDRQLDEKLLSLRTRLQAEYPNSLLDFYEPPLRERWLEEGSIKTLQGEVRVTVPQQEDKEETAAEGKIPEARQSIQIQAKLAHIGAVMGFKIWIPAADRSRVKELVPDGTRAAFLETLPLNYEDMTLGTIEAIDVLWLRGAQARSIARAFEVEHTTAVYSGLLRMADLLALQPNMDIRLHIVAPDDRREKVFREMSRPVFSLLDRGPLSDSCTFISYESVEAMDGLEHLAHTNDSIIEEYEEKAE